VELNSWEIRGWETRSEVGTKATLKEFRAGVNGACAPNLKCCAIRAGSKST